MKKEVVKQLYCKHIFSKDCIDRWLSVRPYCPVCKENFKNYEIQYKKNSWNNVGNTGSLIAGEFSEAPPYSQIAENKSLMDGAYIKLVVGENQIENQLKKLQQVLRELACS